MTKIPQKIPTTKNKRFSSGTPENNQLINGKDKVFPLLSIRALMTGKIMAILAISSNATPSIGKNNNNI